MDHGTILTRIVATPGTCGGVPRLDGTRLPVETLVAELRAGTSEEDIRAERPYLPPDVFTEVRRWCAENGISLDAGAEGGFERWEGPAI